MNTRIGLIGEPQTHTAELGPQLLDEHEFRRLPVEAAWSPSFDDALADLDVLISSRFSRPLPLDWSVRLFQVPGAGLDAVSLASIPARTTVANVYEHETSIAEFVIAGMLAWQIRLDDMRSSFATRTWAQLYADRPRHGELRGKTVGLVGLGRIGRAIAERAGPFGVRLIALSRSATGGGRVEILGRDKLLQLADVSDYIVITCPLSEETRGMINSRVFAQMKASAVLINVARAPIVDELALYRALRAHEIGGAILDVWYQYPHDSEDNVPASAFDFAALDNAWCTPHSSAWTDEMLARRYSMIAHNINALTSGGPLTNVVRASQIRQDSPQLQASGKRSPQQP